MGIIIDVALIALVALSAFAGYKVGLVKLGTGLVAGILAIILTIIIYKPIAQIIIEKTDFDEKIESSIEENAKNTIKDGIKIDNEFTNKISKELLPEHANKISEQIIYILSAIILFILSKIILRIIISFLDIVAKLPILKQFNEVGGAIYGIIRGALIICIGILLIGIYNNINSKNEIKNQIEKTYVTKLIYNTIVRF